MRPILYHVGGVAVHSWGVAAAFAIAAAGYAVRSELQRRAGRGDAAFAITLAAALGGIIGARVYWFFEHLGDASLTDSFSGAGFTWYGGVIGGAAAVLLVARHKRIAIAPLLGACAPALALGYGLGRIACQLAGDGTYGKPSHLPWAMSYPHGEVPTIQRVHPTPVYETLTSLLIFAVLWRLRRRLGALQLFALYLMLAGSERFLVEFLRLNKHVLLGLTQPQLFGAAMVLGGALLWTRTASEVPSSSPGPSRPISTIVHSR
jgi:phosphatidylglycerol---prolipoprotein diacylglyceryl transferase